MFWNEFYLSSQTHFLPDCEKHYFVFTDSVKIIEGKNISIIFQEKSPWPYLTLMRFHMFYKIKSQLLNFDYAFFFNSNIIVKKLVSSEILPIKEDLLGAIHPGHVEKDKSKYKYEDNPISTAFIDKENGAYYFMGGFFGGKIIPFLEMTKTLLNNIDIDFENNLIAKWHDESHLNSYFHNKEIKIIDQSYIYAENFPLSIEPKMLILDKEIYGGHIFLREVKLSKRELIKNFIKKHLYK